MADTNYRIDTLELVWRIDGHEEIEIPADFDAMDIIGYAGHGGFVHTPIIVTGFEPCEYYGMVAEGGEDDRVVEADCMINGRQYHRLRLWRYTEHFRGRREWVDEAMKAGKCVLAEGVSMHER